MSAAVDASREKLALARAPRLEERWQAHLEALRRALGLAAFEGEWAEGRAFDLDRTFRLALEQNLEAVPA
jgi:hypothetical protein